MNIIGLGIIVLIIGMVLISLVVLFIWWIKLRKIKKNSPEFNSLQDIKTINYDKKFIERRDLDNEPNRRIKEAVGGTREQEEEDDEIRRIRERIAKLRGE